MNSDLGYTLPGMIDGTHFEESDYTKGVSPNPVDICHDKNAIQEELTVTGSPFPSETCYEKKAIRGSLTVTGYTTRLSSQRASIKNDLMEEMQENLELLEIDSFHAPHTGEPLGHFQDALMYAKRFITPVKVGITAILATVSIVGGLLIDQNEFSIRVTLPNVKDAAGCLALCEKTLTDTDLAATLGGTGDCTSVDFRACSAKSSYPKLKLEGCTTQITDTASTKDSARCRFQVTPPVWHPYVTLLIFVLAAEGCFQGDPPHILLFGSGCILSLLGIISRSDLFAGMTNSGVLGLAVLSPISLAIGESGIMEKMVGVMLGSPRSLGVALFRMMIPVALLSAFLSNTATVAILIPIVVSWSRRLQVHPGQLLMPLSFAAQLGGSMTLLGSSHCLVAKGAIPASVYDMQFFDLTPIGTVLTLLTAVAIWVIVRCTTLLRSSVDDGAEQASSEDGMVDVYDFKLLVEPGGSLVGKTLAESGIDRLPGVERVDFVDGDLSRSMCGHDALVAVCSEHGVVQLRRVPGLVPDCHKDLFALGRQRHHRHLYEVGIRSHSTIFADGLPSAQELRHTFVAAFVAGPKRMYDRSDSFLTEPPRNGDSAIRGNCVILLEADERAATSKSVWSEEFSLVRKVQFSSPPRNGLPVDRVRSITTFLGFLVLIALVTLKVVKLDVGGAILCLFYLGSRALSPQEFMKSFNPSILGTIVGALALGAALQRSGVCSFLGNLMIVVAKPVGSVGFLGMIYIVAWLMGLVINNSAIVAILGPVLTSVAEQDDSMPIEGLVWALVYGAGTCFTTPLGYQTNLMVIPDGKYTFGDFARFGLTIQFLHFVLTVVLVTILAPALI